MDILSLVQDEEVKQIIIEKKDVVNERTENNECLIDMQLSIRVVYHEECVRRSSIIRVGKYLEHWLYDLKRHELKASTFDRKEQVVKNQIIPYIGAHDLRQLKAKDLQEMINRVSEQYSYSTVKKVYECINACLKYAVKEGKIENNPASIVALPKRLQGDTKEIRCFLPEEAEKIKRECVRCN